MSAFADLSTDELRQLVIDASEELAARRLAERKRQSMATLIRQISEETGVSVDDLQGRDRRKQYTSIRAAFVRAAHAAGHSYTKIGRFLGGRDHTTVMYLRARGEGRRGGRAAA